MCVLRVTSKAASFSGFLKNSQLPVYLSYEKGDLRDLGKRRPYEDYGFYCDVSEREWTDLLGQIGDAIVFLRKHEDELRRLITMHVIDDIRFDFPYSCQLDERMFLQSNYLPPEFLRLAGSLGIGVELSLYPPATDNNI